MERRAVAEIGLRRVRAAGNVGGRKERRDAMKPVRFTAHALEQCIERGASESEVREAVARGVREPAKRGRWMYRLSLDYNSMWRGRSYAIKQVAPVVAEGENEVVVVTVYAFYF